MERGSGCYNHSYCCLLNYREECGSSRSRCRKLTAVTSEDYLFRPQNISLLEHLKTSPTPRSCQQESVKKTRSPKNMGLPSVSSSAKDTLGSTLLGRLLGTSVKSDEPAEALPQPAFKLGEEPHTPRRGSPGFQDGHWVSQWCRCSIIRYFACTHGRILFSV